MLLAADGSMKTLLDFSQDDVAKWERQSAVRAVSWRERNGWFAQAARALEDAQVERVCDLPAGKIQELAGHAERVWKKVTAEAPKG